MSESRVVSESAGGHPRGGASFIRWLGGAAAAIAVLVVLVLTVGPAIERARANAKIAVLKSRLHGLSHALVFYRRNAGVYPPDLTTLEAHTDYLGGFGLADFDVDEQKVQYVIPQSDDPNEAMLYYWPPFDGGTWVLYQNQELDWVKPAPDGPLTNPRTGAVIRPAS